MQETDCRRDLPCTQQCCARRCGLSHDRQRGGIVIQPLYREAATLAKSVSPGSDNASASTKTESWMNQWIDALTLPPPSGTSVLATVYSPKRGKSFLCVAALVD